jgi:hypothetical protein
MATDEGQANSGGRQQTPTEGVSRAQAIMARVAPPERCLSDELIRDRRREEAKE